MHRRTMLAACAASPLASLSCRQMTREELAKLVHRIGYDASWDWYAEKHSCGRPRERTWESEGEFGQAACYAIADAIRDGTLK